MKIREEYLTDNQLLEENRKLRSQVTLNEKRLNDFAFSMADWIWEVDKDGVYTYTSGKLSDILGYSTEELIGKTPFDFMPEEEVNRVGRIFGEIVAKKGPIVNLENRNIGKDGSEVILLTNGVPLLDEKGELSGFRGVDKDITQEKEKEGKLKKYSKDLEIKVEERTAELQAVNEKMTVFYAFAEASGQGMGWADMEGNIHYLNPKLCEFLAIDNVKDFIGKPVAQFYNQETQQKLGTEVFPEILVNGHWTGVMDLHAINGNVTITENHLFVIRDDSGNPQYFGNIVTDITERIKAEEALRESEQRLFQILNTMPVGVFLLKPDGTPYYANKSAKELLGKGIVPDTTAGDLAEVYKAYVSGTNQEYPQEKIPLVRALSGEYSTVEDMEIKRPDKNIQIQVWGAPIHSNSGELLFASAVFGDISILKESEKKLLAALQNLKRSNEELEQFAYIASHDLQEPLRMVSSYTQLLQKRYYDKLDKDANDFIEYAVDGASRMQILIRDLLEYSRVTTKGKEFGTFETSDSLGQARSNLRYRIEETNTLIINSELPEIKGDKNQLTRVFQNLIENAIKFSNKKSPIIHIEAKESEKDYHFSVKDNGIGINPEFATKVFQIFQRLNNKNDFPGTGIGLAICKRIIERHGGSIWVEPVKAGGSIFHFTILKK